MLKTTSTCLQIVAFEFRCGRRHRRVLRGGNVTAAAESFSSSLVSPSRQNTRWPKPYRYSNKRDTQNDGRTDLLVIIAHSRYLLRSCCACEAKKIYLLSLQTNARANECDFSSIYRLYMPKRKQTTKNCRQQSKLHPEGYIVWVGWYVSVGKTNRIRTTATACQRLSQQRMTHALYGVCPTSVFLCVWKMKPQVKMAHICK